MYIFPIFWNEEESLIICSGQMNDLKTNRPIWKTVDKIFLED